MKRPFRRLCCLAIPLAALLLLAPVADTVEEAAYYVLSYENSLLIVSSAEVSAERVLAANGFDPEDVLYEVTPHDSYTAIEIFDALNVSVRADGQTMALRTTGGSVADQLAYLGVTVGEDDLLSHEPDEQVFDGMEIVASRITYGYAYEEETIPHGTSTVDSEELEKGVTEILEEGSDGLKRLKFKETYVDGVLQERTLEETTVVTEPQDTVILSGVKVPPVTVTAPKKEETSSTSASTSKKEETPSTSASKPKTEETSSSKAEETTSKSNHTVSTEDGTITTSSGESYAYSKILTMKGTAYTYTAGSVTSSGAPVQVGIVAALPSTLPQGTRVYITSLDGSFTYGPAIVGDTPGSDIIDLFMETVEECRQFGVQNVLVYVLA